MRLFSKQIIFLVLLSISEFLYADIFTEVKILAISSLDNRAVIKLQGTVHVVNKGDDLLYESDRLVLKDFTENKLLFEYFVNDLQEGYVWINMADSSITRISFTAKPE